nr:hypothetical protein [Qipengyuania proteolytica]
MSDNVAIALLVYTALQIFVTVQAMKGAMGGSMRIAPYFALIVLVVAIIPFCRKYESRWTHLNDEQAHDPALAGAFRRDQIALWALAIATPLVLTGIFRVLFA